jgi:hypothetical protein
MTDTLQDEQPLFDRAVCDGMVVSTPNSWNVIVLTLERTTTSGIGELLHSLHSPEGHPPVTPDDSLFEATYKLDALFERHGKRFTTAIYRVELFEDSWKYHAEFAYGPPRDHPVGT